MSIPRDHPLRFSVHTRLREYHLKRLMPSSDEGLLLDVGCGAGYLTQALGRSYKTMGIDRHFPTLYRNQRRGLGSMVLANAFQLPFASDSFDLIICSEVLEHMPDGLDGQALNEMARVLKPGSRLLLTVPALEGFRARTRLRNLGHDDPESGEYHYRQGYYWHELQALIDKTPEIALYERRSAMFLASELFMDLLKWSYYRKNKLRDHADLDDMKDSLAYKIYRKLFSLINFCFICEDVFTGWLGKGHIHVIALEKAKA